MDFTKYTPHFITMAEAGFIAVNQGDEDSATKLFKAAALIAPDELLPEIGFGYIHLCKLELKKSAEIFEGILEKDPTNDTARTFLGLSLSLNPSDVSKGEIFLEEAAKNAKEPLVKNLASSALEFVERFVKKTPTPTQGAAPK